MQRKVFRIEQSSGRRPTAPAPGPAPRRHRHEPADTGDVQLVQRELAGLREALAENRRALSALLNEGSERRMSRAAGELGASIDAMEKATDKILKSAEVIDDCAKALAASEKSDYERGLTQDIQENLVGIYEACNFQDLTGQRIGKVIGTLGEIEERIAALLERGNDRGAPREIPAASPARDLINGPKLDGDSGHASQRDIDAMFS